MRQPIQRHPPTRPNAGRPRSGIPFACGCLLGVVGILVVVGIVGVIFILPNLPNIAAQAVGFTAQGETSSLFDAISIDRTTLPPPVLDTVEQPAQVTVNLGQYGEQTVPNTSNLYRVEVGSESSGAQLAVASFTEAGLLELCRPRAALCRGEDPRFRNVRIDLRPGGVIIFADVTLPEFGNIMQTVGAVLQLDPDGRRFNFAGVDLNGSLFTAPPQNFGAQIAQFEQIGNDLLDGLTLDAGGGTLSLSSVQIDDDILTVVLR